ncbi:MAG: DUF4105 domain-containing protein, partial [Planctomycetes bacterium]|nr:DUF4105 domain-containing protein [Planctomycetota bacterium]
MSLSAIVAEEEDAQLSVALARAAELRLHRDPYWLTLLHYRDGRSTIDDPTFFLTRDGDRDAAGELVATLTGVLRGDAPGTPEPQHPMLGKAIAARFPARTEWLCAQLGIPRAGLPVDGPAQVDAQLADIQPRGLVLVFASGYLSSPASMFGHTLLLVRGRADSPLLAQGVNYAAQVPATGSDPFSAIKGLFGVYHGLFSVLPYHRKVQEYTDLNQRDLWEYELAMTPEDVRRLMLHAWELQGIWSSYWFFDENCSFNLAALLESARPGLKLSQRAGAWVLPADTVRWVRDAGLISSVSYR